MASKGRRKYVRDRLGRFASSSSGSTKDANKQLRERVQEQRRGSGGGDESPSARHAALLYKHYLNDHDGKTKPMSKESFLRSQYRAPTGEPDPNALARLFQQRPHTHAMVEHISKQDFRVAGEISEYLRSIGRDPNITFDPQDIIPDWFNHPVLSDMMQYHVASRYQRMRRSMSDRRAWEHSWDEFADFVNSQLDVGPLGPSGRGLQEREAGT
jgi:hypothetical protein